MIPIGDTQAVRVGLAGAIATDANMTESGQKLREVSQKLEANFLAEMLKHAGVGETNSAFGGGEGEEQFASFLRQAHADVIAKNGGIGLAEQIFNSLKEANDGNF